MRKGFTLTEMMVVIIILPFVMFLLDGLFGTLLTEIPRSCRMAQQGSMLLGLLEQINRDVGEAKSLPAEFAGRTAGDGLLLVELPEGVIGYQIEEGHVTRSKLTSATPGEPEQERVWSIPNSKIEWQVWQKDGAPSLSLRARPELVEGTPARAGPNGADRVLGGYAVEVKSHVELKVHGRMEKKMARTHLFYGGVLR
jgi:prepilin-type N-terminal cleavage/methylation domain-containing protein